MSAVPSTPPAVRIVEVGPRDGLQNEAAQIPTPAKVAFVRALVAAGLTHIEVTSFVRPDRVPQLSDAAAVFDALGPPPEGVTFSALVPNLRGFEAARAAGANEVAVFTAASETFNRRNVNASIEESLERFHPVFAAASSAGLPVRAYVSTAFFCPFEGEIPPQVTAVLAERLLGDGAAEVSVGDTIGAATPAGVGRLLDVLLSRVPIAQVALHFHDTRGMAVANVLEGLRHGISTFDSSAGGLGGCPFAPGAAGNLATEDLVFLLDGLGVVHGIDLARLRGATSPIAPHLGHRLPGRVVNAPPLFPLG